MDMNERLVALRKACQKKQSEFAAVLGMSQSGLADIESGRRNVTERHLIMLSNWEEYNVNIEWLRTGEGEMFLETETGTLEKLRKEYGLNDRQFRLVSTFLRLPENERDVIMKWLESAFADRKEDAAPDPDSKAARLEEYARQLDAEEISKGKSGASSEAKEA